MDSDTCFINVGIGLWYSSGTERLAGTLRQYGFPGDVITWVDKWPSAEFPREPVYNVKAAAFHEAMRRGYRTIIWGDSSIQALKNTAEFVARVRTDGYWIGQSGYRTSETATDGQLAHFGVSRDWADGVPDCATGLFGVCLDHEKPRQFIEQWVQAGRSGGFSGSRHHARQSKDPRFKFGRQDQSAASIILGKLEMPLRLWQDYVAFAWDSKAGKTFLCQGM